MTVLAKEYGLSDVGLKKICKKLMVPVPGVGYWQRIKSGQKIQRPPLPGLSGKASRSTYTISKKVTTPRPPKEPEIIDDEIIELIKFEKRPENRIKVHSSLNDPHEYVQSTMRNNKEARTDFSGLLELRHLGTLPIKVSPAIYQRALRFMDAFIKAIESRGFKVLLTKGYNEKHCIFLLGERIHFQLSEPFTRTPRKPTEKEMIERDLYPNSWRIKYSYKPTGELRFTISDVYADGLQTNWRDCPNRKLEDQLNSIIIGLIKVAHRETQRRIERQRREQELAEERRRREEIERQKQEERERVKELIKQAESRARSKLIRDFLEAVKVAYTCNQGEVEPGSEIDDWLKWAGKCADQMDPLVIDDSSNGPHSGK